MFSFFKKAQERQFVPTKEEVNNKEIQILSKRLNAVSPKETLANILEWQDRNLKFWEERWLTFGILTFILLLSVITLSLYLQGINNILVVILFLSFVFAVLFGTDILNFAFNLIILFVFVISYLLLLSSMIKTVTLPSRTFFFIVAISLLLGALLSLIINLIMKYKNLKIAIPSFDINDTFKLSLPIDKVLKYRLSVCRDYAKLTSALLLNIYPKEEIYFVLIPQHVAVAIELNSNIYVLDQKLPVLTLDKWAEKWRTKRRNKELEVDFVRIFKDKSGVKTEWLKQKYTTKIIGQVESKLNLEEVTKKIERILKIKNGKVNLKDCLTFKIPLKNYAILSWEDKIVFSSAIEAMKNRIEDELVGNINSICKIDIIKKNKDLILKIWLEKAK